MTQANQEDHSHVKVPDDKEVVYFEGRPVLRGEIGLAALMIVIGLVLILIPFVVRFTSGSFPNSAATAICIVLGLTLPFTPLIFTRTVRYRITSYRIDYEHGIVTKNVDTLELWHVDDISYHQSLADRMLNVGNITVMSNDKSTPKLQLKGLPNARSIFNSLKDRIIAVKRQRGVIKFDSPG
jgi:membrane protein YdbS with pleckstrin-like domain